MFFSQFFESCRVYSIFSICNDEEANELKENISILYSIKSPINTELLQHNFVISHAVVDKNGRNTNTQTFISVHSHAVVDYEYWDGI